MSQLRLAIIGCGAVVEQNHAAALRKLNWSPIVLIDPSSTRRKAVASLFSKPLIEADNTDLVMDKFDAAIVAVPHALHGPICTALLTAGKHVLVEKPLAANTRQSSIINDAARNGKSRLAVALMRRQSKGALWIKDALTAKAFGAVNRFIIREGYEYNWPLTTDSMWRREQAGGGVLIDTGAHTLDQVIWWFGEPDSLEYFDDSDGGVEADCLIRMIWNSGLEGEIELSRTRRLSNSMTLIAERGRLVTAMLGNDIDGDPAMLSHLANGIGRPSFSPQSIPSLFQQQLKSFAAYIRGEPANVVPGEEAGRSVALIERCYSVREPLDLPWLPYSSKVA